MAQEAAEAPAETQEVKATEEGQAPKEESTPETPETFDKEYVKTLRAEAAKHRKEAQEAKQRIEAFEEKDKTELEKLAGKVAKAEKERVEAQAQLLRYEVAAEKEVPAKLVPLLTATTKEDLEAQATLILENAKPAPPDFDGGAREAATEPKTPEQEHTGFLMDLISGKQQQQT